MPNRNISAQNKVIKIFLGSQCNFQCKYCVQTKIAKEVHTQQDFSKIKQFLIDEQPDRVLLWGGEPLLFWETFKAIAEFVAENCPKADIVTITNGSLLTMDKVEFINQYNIGVGLSNDGRYTSKTRNKNVLEDDRIRDCFMRIKHKGICTVLSPLNFDIYKDIWGYFDQVLLGERVNVNIDPVKNCTDLDMFVPSDEDMNVLRASVSQMGDAFIQSIKDGDYNTREYIFFERIISHIKRGIIDRTDPAPRLLCGHGHNIMTIDLEGNIFTCNNSGIVIGTVADKEKANAEINKRVQPSQECMKCPFLNICIPGTCTLISDKERKQECRIRMVFYEEVMKRLQQLADEKILDEAQPKQNPLNRDMCLYSMV